MNTLRAAISLAAISLALGLAACGGSPGSQAPQSGTVAARTTGTTHSVQAPPMPVSPSAAVIASRLKSAGLPVTGLDAIRRDVANQVGGLLWNGIQMDPADPSDNGDDETPAIDLGVS
jgi:hypothetical protein